MSNNRRRKKHAQKKAKEQMKQRDGDNVRVLQEIARRTAKLDSLLEGREWYQEFDYPPHLAVKYLGSKGYDIKNYDFQMYPTLCVAIFKKGNHTVGLMIDHAHSFKRFNAYANA